MKAVGLLYASNEEADGDEARRYLPFASTQTVYHFSATRSRNSAVRAAGLSCNPAGDVSDLSDVR